MPEVEKTSIFGTAVHAVLRGEDVPLGAIESRLRGAGVDAQPCILVEPSLEDVFLDVAQRSAR
jgi:hypothetical protein